MEVVEVEIKTIILADYNPRNISPKDKKSLKDSLLKFGFVEPVIINKNSKRKNILIGGHQRLKIWKQLKKTTVPAVYVNLDLEKEKELNIRLNKNLGEFDYELLDKHFDSSKLVEWGFNEYQFDDVVFINDDSNTIDVEHNHNNIVNSEDAVSLEITMNPSQKKEIMLTINQYKENKTISNGQALYEIVCINTTL